MWHKAEWMGHPMRLELTCVGLLVKFANRYTTKGAQYTNIYIVIKFAYDFYINTTIIRSHHHDVRLARISLTLSLSTSPYHSSPSAGLRGSIPYHHVAAVMNVRPGRPAFDWPYAGVHRSTSLTISSLLLQQCPACLVRLACIVFVIGGRWPYSWRRVGCCCQDLFNIARNILV